MEIEREQFFRQYFSVLTGRTPYPWQRKLFLDLTSGHWPEVVPLPTGSGKTAVMHIWLLALAWSLKKGESRIPRRLAWVVNRRVVVDQASDEATTLAGCGLEGCPEVSQLLAAASASGTRLAVSTLLGQRADDGDWARDPSTPAIIVGTVDMIGSRLLFRGYRSGGYQRPIDAGLLGVDAIIVNDEAHLSPAFARLIAEVSRRCPAARVEKPFRVLLLSATSGETELRGFDHLPAQDAAESDAFRSVFEARKSLVLCEVDKKTVDKELVEQAAGATAGRTLLFIESPEKAANAADRLRKDGRAVKLLTGTMRGLERDRLAKDPVFQQFLEPAPPDTPVWLVATSAAEVGVNLTSERLVTGLVEADHLIQRFGRLNRFGNGSGEAYVVFAPPEDERLVRTLEYLRMLSEDISCRAIWECPPPEEARSEKPRLARLDDRLIETWAQTTYRDRDMPEQVAPWLHGKEDEDPETELAWRADVAVWAEWRLDGERIEQILERYPVRPHERLREPARRVENKLKELAQTLGDAANESRVVRVHSDGSAALVPLPDLLEKGNLGYQLLILPHTLGVLQNGMFRPELPDEGAASSDVADRDAEQDLRRRRYRIAGGVWTRIGAVEEPFPAGSDRKSLAEFARERGLGAPFPVRNVREEETGEMLVYFRPAPKQKPSALRDVPLKEHQGAVASMACRLAQHLGLERFAQQFDWAGLRHDSGKGREIWQRAFGGDVKAPIAKSSSPVNLRLLGGYRHELGSLIDVSETDDLVLHLIASHHKAARPYFTDYQLDPENVKRSAAAALEAACRFARLQQRFGLWGLAYLEALFKCSDGLASDEKGGGESE
jgi:CRISPR-associated endonuclease/helicase Cas3